MYHAHLACVESYVDDGKIRNRTFGSCRRNYERLIAPPVGREKKNYPKDFDNCVHSPLIQADNDNGALDTTSSTFISWSWKPYL